MADDDDLADPEEVDEVSVVMIYVFNGRMSIHYYHRIVLYDRDYTPGIYRNTLTVQMCFKEHVCC